MRYCVVCFGIVCRDFPAARLCVYALSFLPSSQRLGVHENALQIAGFLQSFLTNVCRKTKIQI